MSYEGGEGEKWWGERRETETASPKEGWTESQAPLLSQVHTMNVLVQVSMYGP